MTQPGNDRFKNNRKGSEARLQELLSRQQLHRRKSQLRRRRILTGAAAAVFVLILFFFSPLLKIQRVELTGFDHADSKAAAVAANEEIGRHFLFVRTAALQEIILSDPRIREASVEGTWQGTLKIRAQEYPRDFALSHDGSVYLLHRSGRILDTQSSIPGDVPELLDDTLPLPPGSTMYGEGEKKSFLMQFAQLMEQNTSPIRFHRLDIRDGANVTLDYQDWTVELGGMTGLLEDQEDGTTRLRKKLNAAINTLNAMIPVYEPGIIDLRFDVDPAYRPKGE